MNTAKKGRRKEHQVRDLFEGKGYLVVRSAGSFGPVDLICFLKTDSKDPVNPNGAVILIQVKPRTIYLAERTELEKLRALMPKSCLIEGWVVEDRKKPRRQFSY